MSAVEFRKVTSCRFRTLRCDHPRDFMRDRTPHKRLRSCDFRSMVDDGPRSTIDAMESSTPVLPPLTPALLQTLMRMTREQLLQWISSQYEAAGVGTR